MGRFQTSCALYIDGHRPAGGFMVTTKFAPLLAAMAAALTSLAAHRLWTGARAAGPASEADRPRADHQPAAADPEPTTGFVFYTLDDAFLPYGSDILHWWFGNPVPRALEGDIKKGDLV
jgi:hypothetical protein